MGNEWMEMPEVFVNWRNAHFTAIVLYFGNKNKFSRYSDPCFWSGIISFALNRGRLLSPVPCPGLSFKRNFAEPFFFSISWMPPRLLRWFSMSFAVDACTRGPVVDSLAAPLFAWWRTLYTHSHTHPAGSHALLWQNRATRMSVSGQRERHEIDFEFNGIVSDECVDVSQRASDCVRSPPVASTPLVLLNINVLQQQTKV